MRLSTLLFLPFLLFSASLWASDEPVSTGYFGSTAIGGHDALSYRGIAADASPVKGTKHYEVTWKGAKWRFVSEADSQLFAANPEKYAPAYNGHCANALSLGEGLIETSGKYWAIFDEQLYLFYAPRGAKRWLNGDYKQYKKEADQAWQEILSKRS